MTDVDGLERLAVATRNAVLAELGVATVEEAKAAIAASRAAAAAAAAADTGAQRNIFAEARERLKNLK